MDIALRVESKDVYQFFELPVDLVVDLLDISSDGSDGLGDGGAQFVWASCGHLDVLVECDSCRV